MNLQEQDTRTIPPDSVSNKASVGSKKAKQEATDKEATKRALLKAKVAKELARVKAFRSAFTSENIDPVEW